MMILSYFQILQMTNLMPFLPNISNTSIAGEITVKIDKDTGNTEVTLFYSRLAKIYSKSTNCTVKLPLS